MSTPIVANRDPEGSRLAAQDYEQSGRRCTAKGALLRLVRSLPEPMTSAEIATRFSLDRHVTAKRLLDLADDGLVERCPKRTCRQTGAHECLTWRAVDNGAAPRNHARAEPAPKRQERGLQPGPEPATRTRCGGSGRRKVSAGPPVVFSLCDERFGRTCRYAERRRRLNDDPNSELSPSELEALA